MKIQIIPTSLLLLLTAACASTPSGPPEEIAALVIADLEAGNPGGAEELFESVEETGAYRERIYPILYEAAQERYSRSDVAGAAGLLRFMAEHYPSAPAVQEALLYCLFLERGTHDEVDPLLLTEIEEVADDLRATSTELPVWIDLIDAQQSIDRGNNAAARSSLALFLERWQGDPPELIVYVEDIERYLRDK